MFNFRFPFFKQKKADRFVLVISWGGMRGFYGLGILKALEELGYKEKIEAIYGVSAGALLASYRSAGYSADQILKRFLTSEFMSLSKNLNLIPKHALLKNSIIKKQIESDLPSTFEDLVIPIFVGCSAIANGQNLLLSKGELSSALLWTIAIPGVFPAVQREDEVLIDGGVTNNFPTDLAKNHFPDHKIIWISLNKYRNKPKIRNLLDNLMISFEMMLRKDIETKGALADIFFCRSLETPVLEFNTKKLKKLFQLGYEDGKEKLRNGKH